MAITDPALETETSTENTPFGDDENAAFQETLSRLAADAEREYHEWIDRQSHDAHVADEEPPEWEEWSQRRQGSRSVP